ncbi:MAG TPA: hypothetical protein VMT52_19390 [Planctomycetota bacterium]|nr:hypothetical protein [Planctomycetota bacterium]
MTAKKDLVCVHKAATPAEAELVRSIIDGSGIYAMILDRNTPWPMDVTPLDGEYNIAGSQVFVRPEDLNEAKGVISSARRSGKLTSDDDPDDDGNDDDDDDDDDEEDEDEDYEEAGEAEEVEEDDKERN